MMNIRSLHPLRPLLAAIVLAGAGGGAIAQAVVAPPAAAHAAASAAATSQQQKISYATGVSAIRNLSRNDVAYDLEQVIQGMRDAHAGTALALSEKEIRAVMNQLQVELRRNMAVNQKELAEKNRKRGADYLASFKQQPGVQSLSNGVAYRVLQAGTGAMPTELESVIVKYRGSLTDGTEFDATEDGKTATLRMNQVVMGWREALKKMPAGSKWELVIPPQLAYGERGVGAVIGPNETLVFDVELVEIKR